MSDKRNVEMAAVSFSERLASSQHFAALFRDGMALVDETASYLDGPGRFESKKLERGFQKPQLTPNRIVGRNFRRRSSMHGCIEAADLDLKFRRARNQFLQFSRQ